MINFYKISKIPAIIVIYQSFFTTWDTPASQCEGA